MNQPVPVIDERNIPSIQVMDFYTEFEPDPNNPGENRAIDFVKWVKIGDASGASNVERIDMLRPRVRPAKTYTDALGKQRHTQRKQLEAALEWSVIEEPYNAWKRGEEIPSSGTPLIAWPGADRRLVDALKKLHIQTLEEFVDPSNNVLERVPMPGIEALKKQAENFLLAQGEISRTASALSERDALLAKQNETITNLQTKVEALETLAQMPDSQPEKTEEKDKTETPADPTLILAEYDVEWGGPSHKFRVMHDGKVVEKGFDTKEAAADWAVQSVNTKAA